MAKDKNKIGVHGTDAETGRNKPTAGEPKPCLITRTQFREKAPVAVEVPASAVMKKEFTTGTMGYFGQISVTVMIDGTPVKLTGNMQLYVPNSKDAKE